MYYVKSEVFLFLYSVKIISFLPSVYNDNFTCMKYERTPLTILTTHMLTFKLPSHRALIRVALKNKIA